MLWFLFLVAAGLTLLALGGEALLRGAVGLATLLRLTPAVIGLTIVAAGTSVPELAVSITAALRGSVDLAVGNVVGSNIFNISILIGISALVRPLVISGNTIKLEYPVVVLVTVLFVAVAWDGEISRLEGVCFLLGYVAFTTYMVWLVRRQMSEREKLEYQEEVRELEPTREEKPRVWICLVLLLLGCALLGGGAEATVAGAVGLARLLGMTDRVIGLTVVAIGTSLPEIVTCVIASYRGRDDVALGNAIGSNLVNILIILGASALIRPLTVASEILASDNWWMLAATLLLFPLMFTGKRINRWEGFALVAFYVAYMIVLLAV